MTRLFCCEYCGKRSKRLRISKTTKRKVCDICYEYLKSYEYLKYFKNLKKRMKPKTCTCDYSQKG